MTRAALIDALEEQGKALSNDVIRDMYAEDPFWRERYGERYLRHAHEDANHHASYLVQALRADDVELMTAYARWLQTVLVTRGMCSRHLEDNFFRLSTALVSAGLPDADVAARFLVAAAGALRWRQDAAGTVVDAAATWAADAAARLDAQDPGWTEADRGEEGLRCRLSYLADALALERPELFVDHATWAAQAQLARGNTVAVESEIWDALLATIPPDVDAASRARCRELLLAARGATSAP